MAVIFQVGQHSAGFCTKCSALCDCACLVTTHNAKRIRSNTQSSNWEELLVPGTFPHTVNSHVRVCLNDISSATQHSHTLDIETKAVEQKLWHTDNKASLALVCPLCTNLNLDRNSVWNIGFLRDSIALTQQGEVHRLVTYLMSRISSNLFNLFLLCSPCSHYTTISNTL